MNNYKLVFIILGIIATGIILLATNNYGAGVTPDSAEYIAAARNLAEGRGLLMLHNTHFVWWPPLYPTLLGIIYYIFGIDPLLSARILNAVFFGLIIYLSGILFSKKITSSFFYLITGIFYVFVSSALVRSSLMILTEPLFNCFVLLYLIYFHSYLLKSDNSSLLLMSFSVALASLTRYLGIVLIVTGIINLLIIHRKDIKAKILHLVIFIFISGLPITIWLIRNFFLTGTPFGVRGHSPYTLGKVLTDMQNVIRSWFTPTKILEYSVILIFLSAVLIFLFGISSRTIWKKERSRIIGIGPTISFVIFYINVLIFLSITIGFDKIDDRLMSPVFVPIVFIIFFFIEHLLGKFKYRFKPSLLKTSFFIFFLLFSFIPAKVTFSIIKNHIDQGNNYTSKTWRENELIRYIIKHNLSESGYKVFSNFPDAVYILTNLKTEKLMSPKDITGFSKSFDLLPKESHAFLCWFDDDNQSSLIGTLQTIVTLEQIVHFDDGTLYYISQRNL